ncbi:MAG TPA: hypothetical protein VFS43_02935 [Polyangiaceae bacterium]|nr:hypothetical protein [Polyangiaceae bacterium]
MTAPAAPRRCPPAPGRARRAPAVGPRRAAPLALALALVSGRARADDEANLRSGVNSFEGGRYQECIERFEAMFTEGSPTFLREQGAKSRARMYYASCLTARGRSGSAEEQLTTLALEDPRYAPDSGTFPGPVIDKFYEIREKKKDVIRQRELEIIAREQSEAKARDEARRAEIERRQKLIEAASEYYVVRQNSRVIASLPFGAGQFQNGQTALGWVLLGVEGALAVGSLATYLVATNYERQVLTRPEDIDIDATGDSHERVALANRLLFAGFVATAFGGILHAQATYVPELRERRRRALPPNLLVVPQLSLAPGGGGAGLGLGGRF